MFALFVEMFATSLHTKFHMPSSNGLLSYHHQSNS